MRLPVTLVLGVLALAGCGGSGGGPPIERAVAAKLARAADAVATASEPCSARDRAVTLQSRTVAAINAGRIPEPYLEPLQARVNEIVGELQVRCLPQPAPQSVVTHAPTYAPAAAGGKHERQDEHGRGRGHVKHGHGKHDG
jgi:hypothetical protein